MSEIPKRLKPIIAQIFRELKPKPKSNVLEFSKTHGYLSKENSAVTGRFVPFPYQEDILKDMGDDEIELLVWMKSTRVGYTKCVDMAVAYNIAEDPCPQLVYQPNDKKAGEWSKKELKPMLRDMPYVGDRIIQTREENNLNYKAYSGGFIESRGGNAASNYASATVKKVFIDEYDRYPDDVDGEGDPYELASKRTESYWNGSVFIGSTPTIKGKSKTENRFEETDKRYRYLPCPHCNHYQILEFKNIVWEKEYREGVEIHLTHTAKLKCESCENLIDHSEKRKMDKIGKWRQTKEFFCCETWHEPRHTSTWDNEGNAICPICNLTAEYNRSGRKKRGYHIWAGYSHQPNSTWPHIAAKFVDSMHNVEKMKSFKNTWLGESWEEKSIKLEASKLREDIGLYRAVPDEAKILLMTVDTQNSWLEYVITAWADGETSYNVKAGKIEGDPVNQSVWNELLKIHNTPLKTESGRDTRIYMSFVDMGGGRTDYVKKFVRSNQKQFMMLKGDDKEAKSNDARPVARISISEKEKDRIMWVATNKAKDIVLERLMLDKNESGKIHHNESFSDEWFTGLTAEKKVFRKNKRGFIEQTYIKVLERNEPLDLLAYQLAAIRLLQDNKILDLQKK